MVTRLFRPALAGALLLLGATAAPAQRQDNLTALNAIERGQWLLRGADGAARRMCVTNPAVLFQIMHGSSQCEHFVMESTPRSGVVRYTCPSHGHGRTSIRIETPRLMNIETQGVADGAPVSEQFEARRIGGC